MTFVVSAQFFLGVDRSYTPRIQELFAEFGKGFQALIYKDWPGLQFRRTKRAYEEIIGENIVSFSR